ncbi:hypothetical protein GGS24DRAFT_483945 [Hypoxylon argillaceum]|nr:hypothetical protein GGS24DRAFT_483945 [Hypoxylon argillaceum]
MHYALCCSTLIHLPIQYRDLPIIRTVLGLRISRSDPPLLSFVAFIYFYFYFYLLLGDIGARSLPTSLMLHARGHGFAWLCASYIIMSSYCSAPRLPANTVS